MSDLQTYTDTPKYIYLPALVDGVERSDLLACPIALLFGRALVPANLSARQAKAMGLLTSGTYGHQHSISSLSASLSESLGNRLRQRLHSRGSTLFTLTWKQRVTPLGRVISALRASGHRTSDSGCTGLPTPRAKEDNDYQMKDGRVQLTLQGNAKLSSVPTPQAHDTSWRSDNQKAMHGTKHGCSCLVQTAKLVSVPTPTVHDAERGGQAKRAMGEDRHGSNLQDFALLASVATPNCPAPHDTDNTAGRGRPCPGYGMDLPIQAQLAVSGALLTGGTAATANTGQLNPAYSRWLMGYPGEWDDCAATATPLSRKLRRSL